MVVLNKLLKCFTGEERQDYLRSPSPQPKRLGSEARLAIVSAIMAGSLSLLIATVLSFRDDSSIFEGMKLTTTIGAILALAGLLIGTAAVLAVYTRLRENSVSTLEQSVSSRRAAEYERNVIEELILDGFKIAPSENAEYDFRVEGIDGDVGIEVKYDINQLTLSQIKRKFAKLDELCNSGHIVKAIIVSSRSPLPEVRRLGNRNVAIMPRMGLRDYLSGKKTRFHDDGINPGIKKEPSSERT